MINSMLDPYLINLLKTVNQSLWRWERPTHFNITDISSATASESKGKATSLRENLGINTFFYENNDGRHGQLEVLLKEISQKCLVGEDQQTEPFEEMADSAVETTAQVRQVPPKHGPNSDWLNVQSFID